MAEDSPLMTEQWIEKTNFPIGFVPGQPVPVMRYQLLQGTVHTLQFFPSGAIARGQVELKALPFQAEEEGWYDGDGKFLGLDPDIPEWVTGNE